MRAILAPGTERVRHGRQNGRVTDTSPSPTASLTADRIAARYPKRRSGYVVAALAVAVAILGLGWLMWAALFHANPAIAGEVQSFRVTSDTDVVVLLRVDRPDPSIAGRCTVIAQSEDHRRVGELEVNVPPGGERITDLTVTVRTLGKAVSASLSGCSVVS